MLPKGWKSIALSELQTKTPFVDPKRYPTEMFDLFSVPSYTSYAPECIVGEKIGSVKQEVQSNDILLCKIVPHIRRAWSVPQRSQRRQIASGEWIVFRSDYINPQYLRNFLISDGFHEQFMHTVSGVGGSLMRARPSEAVKILFPLPPLAEQRRIVAKLDSLTGRIARARAELKRVQVLKIHLRQQALRSCFADLEKHELPLGELLRGIEAGKNMRCVERPPVAGEKGVVKVSAVTWGHFDTTQTKTLPNDYLPPTKARIMKGDLLISRANTLELVGAAVIVEVQPDNIFLSDKILRLLVEEDKKSWILWYLRSPEGRSQIESLATGNQLSMRNISQAALRQIKIPLPTASIRQQRLARLTATIKAEVSLETEAQRVLTLLDRLESSLLAKAFRGELVPQNPNDEPASVLLDRIRTERAAAPKPGRKGKA